jgi:methylmalonyl-CoA/ethylmalonyl-CoA epimerase
MNPTAGPLFTRIDHVGIAVRDLDAAISFYERVFGLECVHTEVNEEQGVREAMMRVAAGGTRADGTPFGGSYVQLLQPTRDDSPVGKFIARNGEGVQQVAYGVDDVAATMATLRERGVRVLSAEPRPGSMGSQVAFLHPKDCGGVLVELVQSATTGSADH